MNWKSNSIAEMISLQWKLIGLCMTLVVLPLFLPIGLFRLGLSVTLGPALVMFVLVTFRILLVRSRNHSLSQATTCGDIVMVRRRLAAGASPEERDADGWPALMRAAGEGHIKIAEVLLVAGATPEGQNQEGHTALMAAAQAGHTKIVELLLAAGATPDGRDGKGTTALMLAAHHGYTEIVEALLGAGASPDGQIDDAAHTNDL